MITQFLSVFMYRFMGRDVKDLVGRKLKECRILENRVVFKMSRPRIFRRTEGFDLYNQLEKKYREVEFIARLGGVSSYYKEKDLTCKPFTLILLEAEGMSRKTETALPSRQKNAQLQRTLKEMDSEWKAYVKEVTEEYADAEVFEMYQNKRKLLVQDLEEQQKIIREEEEREKQERLKEAHITAFNKFYHY